MITLPVKAPELIVHDRRTLANRLPRLRGFATDGGLVPLSHDPAWLTVLEQGLGHAPYCLEVAEGETTRGILPLSYVKSLLFGKFLVGLPYLNYGGVLAVDEDVAVLLIDRAVQLADELGVRNLELRHVQAIAHPGLVQRVGSKVHMRLNLPTDSGALWKSLSAKVRNQVRKGEKGGLDVAWGGRELLPEFYDVFSHNMRHLGTPVFGQRLFRAILRQFPDRAELCVVRAEGRAAAAALLLHGWGVTEVPSASSLRRYNPSCANMLMYWHLLERAVRRGQAAFDFGRSSPDSSTYQFKKQWGATPTPAEWQYYVRTGGVTDMRPDNPRYQRLIRLWQHLPLLLTRWIGPPIVRGIP
jgi:FemAB-related protein (PEP-CTERM system-associated)